MTYICPPEIVGVLYPDRSIAQFLFPLIAFVDINLPLVLTEKIVLLDKTGLAEISLISKLLNNEIFETFSDHNGLPVSLSKATSSPLLNGAMIMFSKPIGEAVMRLFLSSATV